MGRKSPGRKIFYMFDIDKRVPEDHLLRQVSRAVDFSFIYDLVQPYYSHTGAPSVDPVVVFKMALLGYLYGITSERKLAEECRLNMAFMWFLGYDIDETPPDHSILSKARSRFGRDVYEQFFNHVVMLCEKAGLIEGNKVFLDATLLKANASLDSLTERRPYQELQTPEQYLDQVWAENKAPEEEEGSHTAPSDKNESKKGKGKPKTNERLVSRTDPDAALVTHNNSKGVLLAHKVHIVVAGGPGRIVTAVETTSGCVPEARVAAGLIGRHIWNTHLLPQEAVADKGYGRRYLYAFLKQAGILPSIPYPKPRKTMRRKKLEAGFVYDEKEDVYYCPQGKKMYCMGKFSDGTALYRVGRHACRECVYHGTLCKAKRPSIKTSYNDELMKWVNGHLATGYAKQSLKERPHRVETAFAELKGPLGLAKATLRGRVLFVTINAHQNVTLF
ncbi:MAG TPA: IS1182 family transposase [Syntrophomonadaceae bacterium]|nr:IS1182 family transposase [Syntrophomonadaceae bacterium]